MAAARSSLPTRVSLLALMLGSPMHHLYLALRFLLVFVPWLAQLLLADLLLSALLPVASALPTLVYNLSSAIAEPVWRGIQRIAVEHNGAQIVIAGDQLPPGESAIVVANHVEWSDFYMIQALALRSGMLGRCRWFAKQQLKWVPFLGWGLWAMGMPLVSRKWTHDKREMDRLFHGVRSDGRPMWLISYSEATRFTPQKYAETVSWCKANDRPIPRHTLHPRTRGFVATVQNLRTSAHVKSVYDVTIAYAKGNRFMSPPSFLQTLFLPNLSETWKMYAHVKRYALYELPQEDREIATWLEARWTEKGNKLEVLRQSLLNKGAWEEDTI